jgi:two-component system phosphate regulon sensor histidine kinase PhoR
MFGKLTVLVVENNVAVLRKIDQLLTGRGYTVITAENSREALDILQKNPGRIEIMLLSLELSRRGAMPLLEIVRKTRSEILVMVMSADCGEEAIEAMRAGAYDCIRKTFTTDRFWTKMDRIIERFRLGQELESIKRERGSIQPYGPDSMQVVFDSMADGVLVTDLRGNLLFCNHMAACMLDISRQGNMWRPIQHFIKDEELVKLLLSTAAEPATCSTSHPTGHQVCLLRAGNKRLRVHVNPVVNREGQPIGAIALLHDVMYVTKMDSIKDDFMFMVSHQLKSPLSSMLMQLSVVLDGLAGDLTEKQRSLLSKTKDKTKGMITLVSDLLDFQRFEEGGVLQQVERLDLREILQRTLDLMAMSTEDKQIVIETNVEEDAPIVAGDRNGIEAIFVNLISNAIKYTPSGGRVTIDIYRSGDSVLCIKVVDTGIGIAQADINRIFDRFYRIRTATTRDIAGSGLGLSIVKRIVALHNGTIHVESEENKGSTFVVCLPGIR